MEHEVVKARPARARAKPHVPQRRSAASPIAEIASTAPRPRRYFDVTGAFTAVRQEWPQAAFVVLADWSANGPRGLGALLLVVGVWHPQLMADQEIRRRKRSFAYDLGVKVLATLVAAAVI